MKLPKIFTRRYYEEVGTMVVFVDQAEKRFDVGIMKKVDKLYFSEGWREVGAYYGLWFGGWIRLMYVDVGRFYLSAYDTIGMEVLYQPVLTPNLSLGQPSNPINISDDDDGVHQLPQYVERQFYRIIEKELTVGDVTSDMVVWLKYFFALCLFAFLYF